MKSTLFINYKYWGLLLLPFCGFSQKAKEIKLAKTPFSDQNHMITYTAEDHHKKDIKLASIHSPQKKIAINGKAILSVQFFRSLIVQKNNKTYDVTIKMNAEGQKLLDANTTDVTDRSIALIFNDTIYQVHKVVAPIIDGTYTISELTATQKEHLVSYYKSLPAKEVQMSFFKALKDRNIARADSLVISGAIVTSRGDADKLILDAYRNKDTLLLDFLKKHDFKPKPKDIYEAMDYEDLAFISSGFERLRGADDFQKKIDYVLFYAIKKNTLPVIKLLIELGADPHIKNNALSYYAASYNKNIDVIEYTMTLDVANKKSEILGYVTYFNDVAVLDYLLEKKGFDINMTYKNGGTILHHMLTYDINQKYLESPSKNFIHKIPLLLARDVDVTRKDMDGNTALHLLVKSLGRYLRNDQQYSSFDRKRIQESIVSAAKQLIDKGADPKAKNKDGLTPLAYGISLEAYQKKAYEKYDITTDKLITYLKTLE